jgi:methyl-accepting chemotaxis protein
MPRVSAWEKLHNVSQDARSSNRYRKQVAAATYSIVQIAESSDEQSTGLNQINNAMQQLDKIMQANATAAEESSSVARSLDSRAIELESAVSELSQIISGDRRFARACTGGVRNKPPALESVSHINAQTRLERRDMA